MKWLSILIPFIVCGGCIKHSEIDKNNYNNTNNCYNAIDITIPPFMTYSVTTKKEGNFSLLLKHYYKKECLTLSNQTYQLWDMEKDKNITLPQSLNTLLNFDINKSFRNVRVRFEYDKDEYKYKLQEISCPLFIDFSKYIITYTLENLEAGLYFYKGKCYSVSVEKETKHYIEYSTDNFAILPKMEIKTNAKYNETTYKLNIETDNKDYNWNSLNFKVESNKPFKYILDGLDGWILFSKNDNYNIDFYETKFSIVDEDDTNDECRFIKSNLNIDILDKYNGWNGEGIRDTSKENTIDIKIRNNTIKDLHYMKMVW
jgi:hypothetical protein